MCTQPEMADADSRRHWCIRNYTNSHFLLPSLFPIEYLIILRRTSVYTWYDVPRLSRNWKQEATSIERWREGDVWCRDMDKQIRRLFRCSKGRDWKQRWCNSPHVVSYRTQPPSFLSWHSSSSRRFWERERERVEGGVGGKGRGGGGASPSMFKGRRLLIVVFVDIVCTDVVDNEGLNERQSFSHTTFFHILFSLFLSSLFPLKEKTKRKTLFRFYIPSDLHHCATRVCAFVATTCALYTLSSFFSVLCGYRLSFSLSFWGCPQWKSSEICMCQTGNLYLLLLFLFLLLVFTGDDDDERAALASHRSKEGGNRRSTPPPPSPPTAAAAATPLSLLQHGRRVLAGRQLPLLAHYHRSPVRGNKILTLLSSSFIYRTTTITNNNKKIEPGWVL